MQNSYFQIILEKPKGAKNIKGEWKQNFMIKVVQLRCFDIKTQSGH